MIGNKFAFLICFFVSFIHVTWQVNYRDLLSNYQLQNVEQLDQLGNWNNDEYLPIRDKKSKSYNRNGNYEDNRESDTAPLLQHARKNFRDNELKRDVCKANMFSEDNKMIDSKLSLQNGAKYVTTEKILTTESTMSINELQEKCKDLCCEDDELCDTSLLSLKRGEEGYRCYLFKCSDRCIFIKHSDYVVLRSKSAELTDQQPITTGHNQNHGYLLNSESMYEEKLDGVKISFESNDKNGNTMNMSSAIILLILGCALVLSFFVFVILSTKYMSKKIKWLRDSKSNKSLDVDGDYLINGMYL